MRKRTGKLYSVFSGLITQYIEYKKNIGCKTTVMECLDTSISSKTISNIFNHILERAGIVRNENRKGPRLHDLRHTFCVNSFVQLCESGKDIHNVMLILMTYMGHQSCLLYTSPSPRD